MRRHRAIPLIAVLTLAALIGLLQWLAGHRISSAGGDWQERVERTASTTMNEGGVVRALGPPSQEMSAEEAGLAATPKLRVPRGTVRVLVYEHAIWVTDIRAVFVYIGRDGRVLGHESRST
jgi:hypothetical protein